MGANWKEIALEKQLEFKKKLGYTKSGVYGKKNQEYENFFHVTDAKKGANFYCYKDPKEWQELREWTKKDKGKRVNFENSGLCNMITSEHIPYNIFYPLEKLRISHPEQLNTFLELLFNNKIKVDSVSRIKIEFAGDIPSAQLLDDNTIFDAYIEYMDGEHKCGLGIEVKYTEKSYPYGKREKDRMFNLEDSIYHTLSQRSNFYKNETIPELRVDQLKQLWKNHLLGLQMVDKKELDIFHSVLLYPEANQYQAEASIQYSKCLKDNRQQFFNPITFEKFIIAAENVFGSLEDQSWISYFKERY